MWGLPIAMLVLLAVIWLYFEWLDRAMRREMKKHPPKPDLAVTDAGVTLRK